MGERSYGVLRGRVVATREERGNTRSPHYQIMAVADGQPWRVAVNVKSTDWRGGPDASIVLYRVIEDFKHPTLTVISDFAAGFSAIAEGSEAGGLDFIRGNLFDPDDMRLLPPDLPDGNDLDTLINGHLERARVDPSAVLFSFGQPWGPEDKQDSIFGFKPNRGIHDIHMNQGNPISGGHAGDNGVWQDGGLLVWFPNANRWVAIFLAFQSQSWHTDDRTGYAVEGGTGAESTRFASDGQRRPGSERARPPVRIIAVRGAAASASSAVLILNTTETAVDVTGWTLATSRSERDPLDGDLAAGGVRSCALGSAVLKPTGGIVSLLDATGLKVTGATYPAGAASRSAWTKLD